MKKSRSYGHFGGVFPNITEAILDDEISPKSEFTLQNFSLNTEIDEFVMKGIGSQKIVIYTLFPPIFVSRRYVLSVDVGGAIDFLYDFTLLYIRI